MKTTKNYTLIVGKQSWTSPYLKVVQRWRRQYFKNQPALIRIPYNNI